MANRQSVAQLSRLVDLAVEPGSPRGAQRLADPGARQHAGRQQVGATQREGERPQLGEITVNPAALVPQQQELLAGERLQRLGGLMRLGIALQDRARGLQTLRKTGQQAAVLTGEQEALGEPLAVVLAEILHQGHQEQAPERDRRPHDPGELLVGGMGRAEPIARGAVQLQPGIDRAQHAQLVQPLDPVQGERRIVEQQGQLVAQPRAREAIEDPLGHRRPREAQGLGRDVKAEPQPQAHAAQDARGIVDERPVVQHPQRFRSRSRRPSKRSISSPPVSGPRRIARVLTVKSRRKRSSRSVAARTSGSAAGAR